MPFKESLLPQVMLPYPLIRNVDKNGDGKFDCFQFKLVNGGYTAGPISSIVDIILSVDGEKVERERITLIVRGQEIPLTRTPTMHEVFWGFGEPIDVSVEKLGGLRKGSYESSLLCVARTTIGYGYPGNLTYLAKRTMKVDVEEAISK